MKAINRQIKLISKIDQALIRIKNKTFGFCAETAEPIGIKRLIGKTSCASLYCSTRKA